MSNLELKGYVKMINELKQWKEFTTYIPAANVMNLEVGQTYPLYIDDKEIGNSEIIKIDGERITFRIAKEIDVFGR